MQKEVNQVIPKHYRMQEGQFKFTRCKAFQLDVDDVVQTNVNPL